MAAKRLNVVKNKKFIENVVQKLLAFSAKFAT